MAKSRPTISVIIPTYNRAGIVSCAIESALAQDYRPIEIIVADDGSTDDSVNAAAQYDVTVIASDHLGPPGIRNVAVAASKGDYIAFLDSDDVWTEGSLTRRMAVFERGSDIGLVFADAGVIDPETDELAGAYFDGREELSRLDTEPLGDDGLMIISDPIPELLVRSFVMTSTVVMPRKVWDEVGGFDESLQFAEDLDLWLRIAECYRLAFSTTIATLYHRREDSNSRKQRFVTLESVKVWSKLHGRYRNAYPRLRGLFVESLGGWAYKAGLIAAQEQNPVLAREYFATAIRCLPTYRRAWSGYVKTLVSRR